MKKKEQTITRKTLAEIKAWSGRSEKDLIDLMPVAIVMEKQINIMNNHLSDRKKKVIDRKQEILKEEKRLKIDEMELDLKVKRMTVEDNELNKVLYQGEQLIKQHYFAAAEVIFQSLMLPETSGNSQMINTYLKSKFSDILKLLGVEVEGKSEIVVPDKRIIIPGRG